MTDLNTFDVEFAAIPSATAERAALRAAAEHADKLGVVIDGSRSPRGWRRKSLRIRVR
jgi:hypothetical protein